jgi:hypothetical protein
VIRARFAVDAPSTFADRAAKMIESEKKSVVRSEGSISGETSGS